MLKNIVTVISLSLLSFAVLAQGSNDRRGFKGVVTAEVKKTIRVEAGNSSSNEDQEETKITFDGRSIKIGNESYEIVKRAFDGEKSTTFTCTKRRGTFEVVYVVGESLKILDQTNKGHEIHYLKISE